MVVLALFGTSRPVDGSDAIISVEGSDGFARPRADAGRLSEWMSLYNDLVFLGRIESSTRESTTLDREGLTFGAGRLCVRIEDLLRGYSSDSVLCFAHSSRLATHRLQPAQQLLVWITRRPDLPRGLEGNVFVFDGDGALLSDASLSSAMAILRRNPSRLRCGDLSLEAVRQRDVRAIVRGAEAIAAVAFAEKRWNLNMAPWKCHDARWVVGSAPHLPTHVRFANTSQCGSYPEASTVLIAVPRGYQGDTLFVDAYPQILRVMAGEVTALGVPLTELSKVLTSSPGAGIEVVAPAWSRGRSR